MKEYTLHMVKGETYLIVVNYVILKDQAEESDSHDNYITAMAYIYWAGLKYSKIEWSSD